MKKDRVLLFNDLLGYGKVALSGMNPVLSYMGYRVFQIPTAFISNTLNYGKFEILDTTDYMINTLKVWENLNEKDFLFDAISTGYILNHRQAVFISEFCKKQVDKGTLIFCDPIMADNGKFYNGVDKQKVDDVKNIIKYADFCVPNYTEAVFLTDSKYETDVNEDKIFILVDKMKSLGAKSVVITSVSLDGRDAVCGYDEKKKKYFTVYYDKIPIYVPGTGDLFLAVLMGEILKTAFLEKESIQPLEQAVQTATEVLWKLIEKNRNTQDVFKGIRIEQDLDIIYQTVKNKENKKEKIK